VSFELNYAMVCLKDKGYSAWIRNNRLVVMHAEKRLVLREVVDELYLVEDSEPDKSYVGKVLDLDQIASLLGE